MNRGLRSLRWCSWSGVRGFSMNGKRLVVVAFAAALLLWLPALSQAATVRVETDGGGPGDDYAIGWVVFRAAPGERNRVVAAVAGRRVVVSDQVPVRPGVGCRREDPRNSRAVRCVVPAEFEAQGTLLFLGDQADSARASRGHSSFGGDSFFGGPGDDLLVAARGAGGARFTGGPGDDRMLGGPGTDTFVADAGVDGRDTMLGRRGSDTVDYSQRQRPVLADLDGRRDDGQRGEFDRIVAVEGLSGGSANDRLVGNHANNGLSGGAGSDQLVGRAGDDSLATGSDFLYPQPARNRADGGRGNDELRGDVGTDLLIGGPGVDWIYGAAGDDTVDARDGFIDRVISAEGCDRVSLDAGDWFQTAPYLSDDGAPPGSTCARVDRDGAPGLFFQPGYGPLTGDYHVVRIAGTNAQVEVGCPGDAAVSCEGTIGIARSGRDGGNAPVSLPPNGARSSLLVPLRSDFVDDGRRLGRTRGAVVIRFQDQNGRLLERRTAVTLIFR